MNNQKLFLGIAVFLSIFLLWDKWDNRNNTFDLVADGDQVSRSNSGSSLASEDIPSVTIDNVPYQESDSIYKGQQYPYITVTTDLLTVLISNKGGTIESAFLNNYNAELNSVDKFKLLNNEKGLIFQAQSGLASANNSLPTHLDIFNSASSNYQLTGDNLVVPLTWSSGDGVEVIKNFYFTKNEYVIKVDYKIINNSNKTIPVKSYVRLVRNDPDQANFITQNIVGGIIYSKEKDSVQKKEFSNWDDFDNDATIRVIGGWMAMIQQYFTVVWIPKQDEEQKYYASFVDSLYKLTNENKQINLVAGDAIILNANTLYLGPKEYENIEKITKGLNYTLDYGWLDIIADPLSWLIHKIYNYINSWGWSIIILTIFIKILFYPLSEKSYRSMAGMRKLAPRIAHIKKAYGDDRRKLGQKTMELYKKEKINPASGCLPILVQMPVFIAFYWMLLDTVELRQTAFWYLPDLAAKDPYFILPIIMGASMFIQQKLNPAPPDPTQAKIMMALPFIFSIMFMWFPSGLVLYWVFNNILSIMQQWTINKRIGS